MGLRLAGRSRAVSPHILEHPHMSVDEERGSGLG